MNSEFRFKGHADNPLAHRPDILFCNDQATQAAFLALGVAPEHCLVSGHPHYAQLEQKMQGFLTQDLAERRAALFGVGADKTVITFVCETLTGFDMSDYKVQDDWTLKGRGQAELKLLIALETMLDVLKSRADTHVVLRLHPKNTRAEFNDYLDEIDQISADGDPLELAFHSDIVCGVETSLLTEACLMGGHTISIQPDDKSRDILPDFVRGHMAMPRNLEGVKAAFECSHTRSTDFLYPYKNPSEMIVKTVMNAVKPAA